MRARQPLLLRVVLWHCALCFAHANRCQCGNERFLGIPVDGHHAKLLECGHTLDRIENRKVGQHVICPTCAAIPHPRTLPEPLEAARRRRVSEASRRRAEVAQQSALREGDGIPAMAEASA